MTKAGKRLIKGMESVLEYVEHPERFKVVTRYIGKGKHKVAIQSIRRRKPPKLKLVGGTDLQENTDG